MKLLSLLLLLCALLSTNVSAALVSVDSRITDVTLFPSSARITRTLPVDLPAGAHQLSVELPAAILRQGMTALPLATGLTIRAVHLKSTETVEDQQVRRKSLRDNYRELAQAKALLLAEQQAIDSQLLLLNTFVTTKEKNSALTLENLASTLKQVGEQETALRKQLVNLQVSIDETQREMDTLQRQLDRLGRSVAQRFHAVLSVYAEEDYQGEIELNYLVNQVQWRPVYSAELDSTHQRLVLVLQADVLQQSGEQWPDVRLTLSNASPSYAVSLPILSSWWLSPADALPRREKAGLAEGVAFSDEIQSEEAPMLPPPVTVEKTDFTSRFVLPELTTVRLADEPQRVRVHHFYAEPQLSLRIIPSRFEKAFVYADFTSPADFPLQPGLWELTRDGQYIGQHRMPLISAGAAIELPLGSDDNIQISRQQVIDKISESGMITTTETLHRRYQVQINSAHTEPRQVIVVEQIPVSRHEDIQVSLDKQTPKPSQTNLNNKPGVLAWDLVLQPGEPVELEIGYTVQYPAGKRPQGL